MEVKSLSIIVIKAFFLLFLIHGVSCQKEEVEPTDVIEKAIDYFPLRNGNQWTYNVEGISEDGQISSTSVEKWKVNPDLFIERYKITPIQEEYLGYWALFLQDALEINDLIGTLVSVKYLNLPADSLIFVASDNVDLLRERWIKGGLTKLNTSFGELECICTKTIYHLRGSTEEKLSYFCKDVGMYKQEHNYIVEDETGESFIGFTWRRTLSNYQIR